ncbi:Lipoprotein releasing system transmembrane protein LolC/LolE [hydrothermal vent metagenome]|uniref:Lipoprotein releasing system transmembrane protein LolC/LolE n=1 Tax=hydrothermal vent metagenome TaxID=652676 RepID=A0A3B0RAW9_9ZZZZ
MNVSLYIAKRYLLSKSSNNAINIITIIAAIGVIIGSASLFIVLSGFAGLKDFSLQFSSLVDPDLKAIASQGKSFTFTQDQLNQIHDLDIISYSKVIEERVVLNFNNKNLVVNLKGVDENYPKSTIDYILVQGQWFEPNTDQIVAGWGVSNNLSFGVFDYAKTIRISVPKPGKGQISSIKSAFNSINATNSGVFQINEDLDNSYVYANLETVKYLLNYKDNQVSAIEFQVSNLEDIDTVRQRLYDIFGDNIIIKTRAQLNDALYKMLNTENLAVYLIFTLVLIIALFNVIGSIIMMILDKKKNLNTLFNLGVTLKDIRHIFFLQGSLMTVLGGGLGLLLGYVIILLQDGFSLIMITPSLPYPVTIKPINFIIVFATISVLGILASKIASSRISKQLITTF